MKRFFKGIAKWLGGIVGSVISFILIIVLLPYAASLADRYLPDVSGGRVADSIVLSEQLQGSARLETNQAEQTGVITHEVNDILGRTVTTTNIHYEYEASFGIDLQDVDFSFSGNQINFILPAIECLNDSLTALAVEQEGTFDRRVRPDAEKIEDLKEQKRLELRAEYLTGEKLADLRANSEQAIRDTIAAWLSETNDRYTYTFQWADQPAQ